MRSWPRSGLAATRSPGRRECRPTPGFPPSPECQQGVIGWRSADHFHVIARRESNDKRQVIVSNEVDFFQDFEKTHGATLPTESVTSGNEWDLYSASMAETTSRVKRAVEKLRAAELMATLVALKRPDFTRSREQARDQAFTDLGLYWEHDWTADGPVSRPARAAWQDLLAAEIDYYVNTLHADAANRLGGLIPKVGPAARFFVLNPLGWTTNRLRRLRLPRLRQNPRPRPHFGRRRPAPGGEPRRSNLPPHPGKRRTVCRLQDLRDPGLDRGPRLPTTPPASTPVRSRTRGSSSRSMATGPYPA